MTMQLKGDPHIVLDVPSGLPNNPATVVVTLLGFSHPVAPTRPPPI